MRELYRRAVAEGRREIGRWEPVAKPSPREVERRRKIEERVELLEREIDRLGSMDDDQFRAEKSERVRPALALVSFREKLTRAQRGLLLLQAAIRVYQADNGGRPPRDLSELAPDILFELPDDPFCETGFYYDAANAIAYSAGPDGSNGRRRARYSQSKAPKSPGDIWLGP